MAKIPRPKDYSQRKLCENPYCDNLKNYTRELSTSIGMCKPCRYAYKMGYNRACAKNKKKVDFK